jgi:hypothetical protein
VAAFVPQGHERLVWLGFWGLMAGLQWTMGYRTINLEGVWQNVARHVCVGDGKHLELPLPIMRIEVKISQFDHLDQGGRFQTIDFSDRASASLWYCRIARRCEKAFAQSHADRMAAGARIIASLGHLSERLKESAPDPIHHSIIAAAQNTVCMELRVQEECDGIEAVSFVQQPLLKLQVEADNYLLASVWKYPQLL